MQQQEDGENEDMNQAPKHSKLDEMSCMEDVDVWDSDDETGAAQRMRAQEFISSHLILSKFSLLVNFMSVRNLVTQSSLGPNACLLQLASSSFSNTSQKGMAKTLLALYNRKCKIYSVFAYRDSCVILFYDVLDMTRGLGESFHLLFWMSVLCFSACTNRGMMKLWKQVLERCTFVSSARYVWNTSGCELMHHADPLCFRSCTRRGNGPLQETRTNLIQALSRMCACDDGFLESSYRNLIMGRLSGPKAILRMARKCGLRWVGNFKAYFTCTMLGQHFPDIYNPVLLGPHVHLHARNSAMAALFGNYDGTLNEHQVYDVFFELCFLLAEHIPSHMKMHLQPHDVQHSLCEWIKVDKHYPLSL